MPQYRVEISPNRRAGCQDKQCKDNAVKLDKGELRFGTWVELGGYPGTWRWKHWGCVSGKQIEHLRDVVTTAKDPTTGDTVWDFNLIDGFDELEGEKAKEFKGKIRTAVIEGKIADEDFNGDPECNVLGKTGIRKIVRKTKAKPTEEGQEGQQPQHGAPDVEAAAALITPPPRKRARSKKAVSDENDDEPVRATKRAKTIGGARRKKASKDEEDETIQVEQPKKSRAKKVNAEPKVEQDDLKVKHEAEVKDESEVDEKPVAKKARPSKIKAEVKDESEVDEKPVAKKARPSKVKAEVKDESEVDEKPVTNKRRSSKIKAEPQTQHERDEELTAIPEKPARKARAKKAVKDEPEVEDEADIDAIPQKPAFTPPVKVVKTIKIKHEEEDEINRDATPKVEGNEEAAAPEEPKRTRAKKAIKIKLEGAAEPVAEEASVDAGPIEEEEGEPETARNKGGRKRKASATRKRGKQTA